MSKDQVIERERRGALTAGVAALVASLLLIGAYISYSRIPIESTLSAQLVQLNDHSGALAVRSILTGIGFLVVIPALVYLFRAAQARSDRVRPALIVVCVLGPLFFGVEALVNWPALNQVSSDFVAQSPDTGQTTYKHLLTTVKKDPSSINKVTLYTDDHTAEVELSDGSFAAIESYPSAQQDALTKKLDDAGIDHTEDSNGQIGDALATKIQNDSNGVKVATALSLLAAITMILALVYTPLQAMRVGLLSRTLATLGMILGVGLVLLPIPQLPLVFALWLGWLGLIYLDRVPRGRPPAWDAGEAVPWIPARAAAPPAPGDGSGDTVEGSATEVTGNGDTPSPSATPAAPRQKRKRRR